MSLYPYIAYTSWLSSFLGGKISAGDSVTTLDTQTEEIRTPLTKIEIDVLVRVIVILVLLQHQYLDTTYHHSIHSPILWILHRNRRLEQ
jgi:hypothetical protein